MLFRSLGTNPCRKLVDGASIDDPRIVAREDRPDLQQGVLTVKYVKNLTKVGVGTRRGRQPTSRRCQIRNNEPERDGARRRVVRVKGSDERRRHDVVAGACACGPKSGG